MLYHRCAFCTNPALIAPTMIKVSFINSLIYIYTCMYASYTMPECFSESVCRIIFYIATRVCKFLHACVAPYTRVHESKISTRFCVCCVRVTRVWTSCYTPWDTRGPFKLWVICTVYSYNHQKFTL